MTFQDSINAIASSIIDEQKAISTLIQEETLKIQKFIDLKATQIELAEVNELVNQTVSVLNQMSILLNSKFALIAPFLNP